MKPQNENCIRRVTVAKLDRILGVAIPVLNGGFIRPVDYMGSDESIVQAARVSYGKGTKKVREDRGLIRYLMRHRHTTPFEMCVIKLHLRVPMDCWRQWIRHRTASVNEYSTRYSIAIDAAQQTDENRWRQQNPANRQGSTECLPPDIGKLLSDGETRLQSLSREVYEERLTHGVAREQARKDLPLSTYTEAYWTIDLHNLFHFLELRLAPSAQLEIRKYANVIAEKIVSVWCPLAWDAFLEYRVDSLELSSSDLRLISTIQQGRIEQAIRRARSLGWISADGELVPKRERYETEEKLTRLGLVVPWKV